MVPASAVAQGAEPVGTGVPPIVEAAVSVSAKPVPVTVTVEPTGPELGDTVSTCGNTVSVVEACTGVASFTITV